MTADSKGEFLDDGCRSVESALLLLILTGAATTCEKLRILLSTPLFFGYL